MRKYTEKKMSEYDRIIQLIGTLKDARIYAGAEFEHCCDNGDSSRAIYFSGLMGMLKSQIDSLEDSLYVFRKIDENEHAPDRCPICGRKTRMSKNPNVGKICIYCVNKARGY